MKILPRKLRVYSRKPLVYSPKLRIISRKISVYLRNFNKLFFLLTKMAYMNVFKRLKSINTCMMFYVLFLYANIMHKYKTMPFNIGELHFSTNCKVDTNNLLSYFSDFLYLQLKSAAAQFQL